MTRRPPRALVLCPGRGSYTARQLGWLERPAGADVWSRLGPALDRVNARRGARGDPALRDIDAADGFRSEFLEGHNAAAVTFACTAFDWLRLDRERLDVVAVGGNSLGWYSALFVAGALDLDATFELVETMGGMTRDRRPGGQVVYPLVDDDWRDSEARRAAVEAVLGACHDAGQQAGWSIRFGGYAVLWGDEGACETLLEALPSQRLASREYPLRLPGHAAFHSPLMRFASEAGLERLVDLPWSAPRLPLIDGLGRQWRPLAADPAALRDYTLVQQVTETFDFAATVRVGLRECAPDLVVLLGPGDTLGGAVGQVVVAERWQGIDSRSAFEARQAEDPFLLSLARPEQAARICGAPTS